MYYKPLVFDAFVYYLILIHITVQKQHMIGNKGSTDGQTESLLYGEDFVDGVN